MNLHTSRHLDLSGALAYARSRLRRGLDPAYAYHNYAHTFEDVLPAAIHLAKFYALDENQLMLLTIAVAYHDIGFTVSYHDHEQFGIAVVQEILPRFGFNDEHLPTISNLIWATRLPHKPGTILEKIIVDADLDVLGRSDFWLRNAALRQEMATFDLELDEIDWLISQWDFLNEHHYFTGEANRRRRLGKARNRAEVARRLTHALLVND